MASGALALKYMPTGVHQKVFGQGWSPAHFGGGCLGKPAPRLHVNLLCDRAARALPLARCRRGRRKPALDFHVNLSGSFWLDFDYIFHGPLCSFYLNLDPSQRLETLIEYSDRAEKIIYLPQREQPTYTYRNLY